MNDKGLLLKIHPKMAKGKEKSGQGIQGFLSRPCRVGCCPVMKKEFGPDVDGDAGSGRRQRWAGRGHMTLIILEINTWMDSPLSMGGKESVDTSPIPAGSQAQIRKKLPNSKKAESTSWH